MGQRENQRRPRGTRSRLLSTIVAAAVAAGCNTAQPAEPHPVELVDARARWSAEAPASYRFDLDRHCFCLPEAVEPVTIEVRNGTVASVHSRRTGAAMFPSDRVDWYTIEELFQFIDQLRAAGTGPLLVRYHPAGYPTLIEAGSLASDGGIRYTLANMVSIDG